MTRITRNEILLKDGTIHCQKCEARIMKVLTSIEGVLRVDIDGSNNKVCVNFNPDKLDSEHIEQILERIGFPIAMDPESQSENE